MNNSPWPIVALDEVLSLSIDAVPVDPLQVYRIAGVYSFARGLLKREPLLGSNTTYKVFHRLHKDDFVISQPKAWEGALARITSEFEGWFLSPVFPTFHAISDRLDIRYLEWYCRQAKVWNQLKNKARGIGARRESVLPKQFLSLQIPLPPLAEQRRIVARIEALAARVEAARKLREQVIGEVESLWSIMLAKAYDEAEKQAGEVKRLDDLCHQITDGTHSTPTYVETGVPFLSVKDITSGQISFSDTRFITAEEHNQLIKRCHPEFGDVLLTKVGTTGFAKAIDVHREFSIFVSLALLKIDHKRLAPKFTEYMLNSPRLTERSKAGTRGVGNKNLVLKFIRDFPMPAPSLPEQRRIVARLDALQAKIAAVQQHQVATQIRLDALMPSILDRAFKGEL